MKIGIDIRPLMEKYKTGVGEYTQELIGAILSLDKTNEYFLFYNSVKFKDKLHALTRAENAVVKHSKIPNKIFNLSAKFFNAPKIEKIIGTNLDYFYSPNLNFTPLSKNTKFAVTVHDLSFELYPHFFTAKQNFWHKLINPRVQCERANLIFVPSENTKRDLIDIYKINEKKIIVAHPGISSIFNIASEELEKQKLAIIKKYSLPENFILFLGTIEPRKNISSLIKAFEMAHKCDNSLNLVIAGINGWKNREIYKTAESSDIKNKIKFLGFIKQEEKPALYSLAKIFIYPSFCEGFGLPVIEAMKMGAPIITSNRSSLCEISGDSAMLINPNNLNMLADGIKKMITNKKTREYYSRKSKEKANEYDWRKTAKTWIDEITKVR